MPTEKNNALSLTCKQNNNDSARERIKMVLASLGQLLPLKLGMPLVTGVGQEEGSYAWSSTTQTMAQ